MSKKLLPKIIIEYLIYFLLLQGFLISVLHFPSVLQYILDLGIIFLLFYSIIFFPRLKVLFKIKPIGSVFRYILFLIIILAVSALLHFVPVFQVLWALRNNLFYPLFFVFCILYLRYDDTKRIMNNVITFQIINFICAVFEYFALHRFGDNVGGMFGIAVGGNGLLNVYLFIICAYVLSGYFDKKINFIKMALIIMSSIAIATISELKVFYFEILLIFILQFLFGRKSLTGFFVLIIILIGIGAGLLFFTTRNSESARYLSSIEDILNYNSRSDYGNGDIRIARLTFISQINEYFFHGNLILNLFGYGFGFCEDSKTFALFNSAFADKYSYLQYRNISSSMLYLETGAVGLIAFIGLFVLIFAIANKFRKSVKGQKNVIIFTMILSSLIVVNIFYNSAIRREIAYLIYFAFAVFFIMIKEVYIKKKIRENKQLFITVNERLK